MIQDPRQEGPRTDAGCLSPVRVLLLRHVQDDTYAIFEDGDVSLSDGATLTLLLEQLTGREAP